MPKISSHIRIDTDLLDELSDQLSHAEFRFLTFLLRHAKNGFARPGVKRLAALMQCTERSIRRYRAKLEELGFITVTPRYAPNGRQRANKYHIMPMHNRAGDEPSCPPPPITRGGQADPTELFTNATRELKERAKEILRKNGVVTITKETLAWQIARM